MPALTTPTDTTIAAARRRRAAVLGGGPRVVERCRGSAHPKVPSTRPVRPARRDAAELPQV